MAPILPLILVAGLGAYLLLGKKGGGAQGTGQTDPNNPQGAPQHGGGPLPPLTKDEVKLAVQTALNIETDPAKLNEFADSLLPDYVDYATQLHARATQFTGQPIPVIGPAPTPSGGGGGALPPVPVPVPQPSPQPAPAPLPLPEPAPQPQPVPVPNPTPQAVFPDPGSTAYVTTHDTGPSGRLNIRDTPSTSGNVIGQVEHGTGLTIEGPAVAGGAWYPVVTPMGAEGYAFAQYLGPQPPADAADPTGNTGVEHVASSPLVMFRPQHAQG